MNKIMLEGAICGPIWWPVGLTCGRQLRINLLDEKGRFSEKPTLRDILLSIQTREGGDFQSCGFTEDSMIVSYRLKRKDGQQILHAREWPITAFKSVKDLIEPDTFANDFT